jgi:hypothetical protein
MIAVLILSLWAVDNSEYVKTVANQIEEGYKWTSIECREANESLPAITIDSPTGKRFVCHKLMKW